jgi:hypothetical protein
MDKLWLLFPIGIISKVHCVAGDLQNQAERWLKIIEDKKLAAVDSLYYEWHEHEDV